MSKQLPQQLSSAMRSKEFCPNELRVLAGSLAFFAESVVDFADALGSQPDVTELQEQLVNQEGKMVALMKTNTANLDKVSYQRSMIERLKNEKNEAVRLSEALERGKNLWKEAFNAKDNQVDVLQERILELEQQVERILTLEAKEADEQQVKCSTEDGDGDVDMGLAQLGGNIPAAPVFPPQIQDSEKEEEGAGPIIVSLSRAKRNTEQQVCPIIVSLSRTKRNRPREKVSVWESTWSFDDWSFDDSATKYYNKQPHKISTMLISEEKRSRKMRKTNSAAAAK